MSWMDVWSKLALSKPTVDEVGTAQPGRGCPFAGKIPIGTRVLLTTAQRCQAALGRRAKGVTCGVLRDIYRGYRTVPLPCGGKIYKWPLYVGTYRSTHAMSLFETCGALHWRPQALDATVQVNPGLRDVAAGMVGLPMTKKNGTENIIATHGTKAVLGWGNHSAGISSRRSWYFIASSPAGW